MSIRFLEPEDVFAVTMMIIGYIIITMMIIGYIIIIPIIIISIHHDYSAEKPEMAQAIQPAIVRQCPRQYPYHHGGGQRQ